MEQFLPTMVACNLLMPWLQHESCMSLTTSLHEQTHFRLSLLSFGGVKLELKSRCSRRLPYNSRTQHKKCCRILQSSLYLPTPNSSNSCSTALAFLVPTEPGIFIWKNGKKLGNANLTPNPQPGGPGDHSLSGLYPLTCPAWVTLPGV